MVLLRCYNPLQEDRYIYVIKEFFENMMEQAGRILNPKSRS